MSIPSDRGLPLCLVLTSLCISACGSLSGPSADQPGLDGAPVLARSGATELSVVRSIVIRNAKIMTAAGPTEDGADLWLRGATVAGVGRELVVPEGTEVIDANGAWVTPGLIDPHSHIGVYGLPTVAAHADGNEASAVFRPEVRAVDSFWPQDPAIEKALSGGVTTIHVLPGSANLVGGQGVSIRLRPALSASAMVFEGAPASMKMACGENPKRVHGKGKGNPQTRMGEMALMRQWLEDARGHSPKAAKPDLKKDPMAAVASGEIRIQNHCYRADEMLQRLELFKEYGVKPRAFHHAVEAYKVRDALAEAEVGAVVWADWWGVKMELFDMVPANAALLDQAGVRVALHSDSPAEVQHLNREAAKALASGLRAGLDLDRDDAIRWITVNPAWILGIDDRVGTLEVGKQADFVIWSGDPLSVYAQAKQVYIQGEVVYDREQAREPISDFELGIRKQ